MAQIQDYDEGTAQDPFLSVAAKPATDLRAKEHQFALQYLFQANPATPVAKRADIKNLAPATCVAHALGYAIWRAENLSRFNCCVDTHRFRPPSVLSAASKDLVKR